MKTFLQLSILSLTFVFSVQSTGWETVNSGTTKMLFSITSLDANRLIAVGADGMILRSYDGGNTWIPDTIGAPTNWLYSVVALNERNIWISGCGGTIMYFNGSSWSKRPSNTTNTLNGISFSDTNVGWTVGQQGTILKTTDGGNSWTSQTSGTSKWLNNVHASDTDNVIAVGDSGEVLRTTNGGTNWTKIHSRTNEWLGAVCFTSANRGWISGSGGTMLEFIDTNCATYHTHTTKGIVGMSFTKQGRGFGVGDSGAIFHYNGSNWVQQTSPTGKWLNGVHARCDTYLLKGNMNMYAWAVGQNGTILKYVENITGVTEEKSIPNQFELHQNYPNPFNPTTTIRFDLSEDAIVTLKIYNSLGQEVASILDREEMYEGEQEVDFDATSLPSGVYMYRIVAERMSDDDKAVSGPNFFSVKKMVLMK
ncbi:MAG: T9SS type A sorting domain-containing protein [Ignavibacteriae bacterium]|nr:T9SS type A sorting domain-containing protein [Ignavibacteriota bacterium]